MCPPSFRPPAIHLRRVCSVTVGLNGLLKSLVERTHVGGGVLSAGGDSVDDAESKGADTALEYSQNLRDRLCEGR